MQTRQRSATLESIVGLCQLCWEGRLYEVEKWIAAGKPIQSVIPADPKHRKRKTPLQIAATMGFHSLAELLLINGYDPNGDFYECLTPAVTAKNHSMVDLLLDHGADPNAVSFETVLETYDRGIMDLFVAAGVDPCKGHFVAWALRHKKRPHLGFVKSYSERFPGLLRQASIALHSFAYEGDVKGVSMMLWLGADPYEQVPEIGVIDFGDDAFEQCALTAAAVGGHQKVIDLILKVPIPVEDVQRLFRRTAYWANPTITKKLLALGANPNEKDDGRHVIDGMVNHAIWGFGCRNPDLEEGYLEAIRLLAQAGAKWDLDQKGLATLRRRMLKGQSWVVRKLLGIFRLFGVLSEQQLQELTRTPGMNRILAGKD